MPALGAERLAPPRAPWRAALQPIVLAALVFLTARFRVSLPHGAQRIAPVWLASAVVLSNLLRTPGRRWAWLVLAAVVGQFLAGLSLGFAPMRVAVRVAAAAVEYTAAAALTRRLAGSELDLERPRHLAVLCACALSAALATGGLQSVGTALLTHEDALANMRAWRLSRAPAKGGGPGARGGGARPPRRGAGRRQRSALPRDDRPGLRRHRHHEPGGRAHLRLARGGGHLRLHAPGDDRPLAGRADRPA